MRNIYCSVKHNYNTVDLDQIMHDKSWWHSPHIGWQASGTLHGCAQCRRQWGCSARKAGPDQPLRQCSTQLKLAGFTQWYRPIPALPLSWYWCSRAEGVSLARGARESCAARMAPKPPTMRDCKHKELAWVTATTSETQLSNADNPMPHLVQLRVAAGHRCWSSLIITHGV